MAIKTFTTGEVLTASDTNTYLANSGLVFIKQQTVGNAVASVTVSSAFSADYDNYKITYSAGVASNPVSIQMVLGASVTGYHLGLVYVSYGSTTPTAASASNAATWPYVGEGSTGSCNVDLDLFSPFLAKITTVSGTYAGTVAGNINGYHNSAVSYSAFTLSVAGNTMTGGTITVYGYRKQ